ncbi:hypothetical protein F5Y15DRAFT_390630 [Xylariaceae sp. FL0016]|nr:hypothetical protein F5Y15DRAFT_390630 [Xylariaceae sp. FL0016]
MAVKNDSQHASRWQKWSGLIGRHGSAKPKKAPEVSDEMGGVFKLRRPKQEQYSASTLDFKPLEVDLKDLEKLRIAEGWLESPTRPDRPEQDQKPAPPPPPSTTPIADLFASKSSEKKEPEAPVRVSLDDGANGIRPQSMFELQQFKQFQVPADRASIYTTQTTSSILDRGRPLESRRVTTDPTKVTNAALHDAIPSDTVTNVSKGSAARDRKGGQIASVGSHSLALTRQAVPIKLRTTEEPNRSNRHSMYAAVPPAQNKPSPLSAVPRDRIQTWQKNITSAPSSQGALPIRRVSTRGVGDRLAWIKELEEKKSSSVNRDLDVLKRKQGSVSDKLAMFEKHDQATSRLPPLTRTNSTTSRLSSVGLESASSAYGHVPASSRTSIDTVRSSHRTSSVMDNYDDAFREKMEGVANGQPDPDEPKRQRVTTQFVSVEPPKDKKKKRRSGPPRNSVDLKSPRNSVDMKSPRTSVDMKPGNSEQGQIESQQPALSTGAEAVQQEKRTKEDQPSLPLQDTNNNTVKTGKTEKESRNSGTDHVVEPQPAELVQEESKPQSDKPHSVAGDEPTQVQERMENVPLDSATPTLENEPPKTIEPQESPPSDLSNSAIEAESTAEKATEAQSSPQMANKVELEEANEDKSVAPSDVPLKNVTDTES